MTTHEKFLGWEKEILFQSKDNKREDIDLEDKDKIKHTAYIKTIDDEEVSFQDYYLSSKELKPYVVNYPLIFNCLYSCYDISDETKKQYLKYNDEERIKCIAETKKQALLNSKRIIKIIDETIYTLDIAYLENQLYDFKVKKRSK